MSPGFTMVDNDTVIDRLPEIDGTAIKVYLTLARRSDSDGRCWPSQGTIAKDTGLQPRAVRNALKRLRGLGLVTMETRIGNSTIYHITPALPCRPTGEDPASSCRTPRHRRATDPGTAVPPNKNKEQKQLNKNPPIVPQGTEGKDGNPPERKRTDKRKTTFGNEYSHTFLGFWDAYPPIRKTKKPDAWRAWQKAITRAMPAVILKAAEEFASSPLGKSRYCPGPGPWLNNDRWDDDRQSWQRSGDEDPAGPQAPVEAPYKEY